MLPLGLLAPGEMGEIVIIRAHVHGKSCCGKCGPEKEKNGARMEDMGLRIGKRVEMLNSGGGPVLLKIDESRIALDRGLAMKIMVRKRC